MYIANQGALDDIPVERVREFESQWHDYAAANLSDVLKSISESGDIGDNEKNKLDEAVKSFKQTVKI